MFSGFNPFTTVHRNSAVMVTSLKNPGLNVYPRVAVLDRFDNTVESKRPPKMSREEVACQRSQIIL